MIKSYSRMCAEPFTPKFLQEEIQKYQDDPYGALWETMHFRKSMDILHLPRLMSRDRMGDPLYFYQVAEFTPNPEDPDDLRRVSENQIRAIVLSTLLGRYDVAETVLMSQLIPYNIVTRDSKAAPGVKRLQSGELTDTTTKRKMASALNTGYQRTFRDLFDGSDPEVALDIMLDEDTLSWTKTGRNDARVRSVLWGNAGLLLPVHVRVAPDGTVVFLSKAEKERYDAEQKRLAYEARSFPTKEKKKAEVQTMDRFEAYARRAYGRLARGKKDLLNFAPTWYAIVARDHFKQAEPQDKSKGIRRLAVLALAFNQTELPSQNQQAITELEGKYAGISMAHVDSAVMSELLGDGKDAVSTVLRRILTAELVRAKRRAEQGDTVPVLPADVHHWAAISKAVAPKITGAMKKFTKDKERQVLSACFGLPTLSRLFGIKREDELTATERGDFDALKFAERHGENYGSHGPAIVMEQKLARRVRQAYDESHIAAVYEEAVKQSGKLPYEALAGMNRMDMYHEALTTMLMAAEGESESDWVKEMRGVIEQIAIGAEKDTVNTKVLGDIISVLSFQKEFISVLKMTHRNNITAQGILDAAEKNTDNVFHFAIEEAMNRVIPDKKSRLKSMLHADGTRETNLQFSHVTFLMHRILQEARTVPPTAIKKFENLIGTAGTIGDGHSYDLDALFSIYYTKLLAAEQVDRKRITDRGGRAWVRALDHTLDDVAISMSDDILAINLEPPGNDHLHTLLDAAVDTYSKTGERYRAGLHISGSGRLPQQGINYSVYHAGSDETVTRYSPSQQRQKENKYLSEQEAALKVILSSLSDEGLKKFTRLYANNLDERSVLINRYRNPSLSPEDRPYDMRTLDVYLRVGAKLLTGIRERIEKAERTNRMTCLTDKDMPDVGKFQDTVRRISGIVSGQEGFNSNNGQGNNGDFVDVQDVYRLTVSDPGSSGSDTTG